MEDAVELDTRHIKLLQSCAHSTHVKQSQVYVHFMKRNAEAIKTSNAVCCCKRRLQSSRNDSAKSMMASRNPISTGAIICIHSLPHLALLHLELSGQPLQPHDQT